MLKFGEIDVSHVLHDTRTAYLRGLDVDGKTLVSVGAAGQWYFDWIHSTSGYPGRHIGVELYMPKPDHLPDNVEWIANTAGDMRDVQTGVADCVFSGQNIEHLWEDDVTKFLMESNRILKVGGMLAIDSPNRIITEALCITHPEHMVEFTPDEMVSILAAAGFDVVRNRGIFLSRDPKTGHFLPYQPASMWGEPWSLTERCALADDNVDDSYLWWIEACKADRPPDEARVRLLIRNVWELGWPERMRRFSSELSEIKTDGGRNYYQSAKGQQGAIIFGPYAPVSKGRYRASMNISRLDDVAADLVVGVMDIVMGADVLIHKDIHAHELGLDAFTRFSVEFSTNLETSFGFECRIVVNGSCGLMVERDVALEHMTS